ncbi:MAG: HEPN domain-containing protein [Bacteroidales bacterium]|nr:HEPN domain-containing protein [Bacteroidales bacterium]
MKREERIDYWLSVADYDLETAEAMYSTGRWLYVAFMCHQVIEKTLKAYWCATKEDEPPYIHSHKRLADGSGLYSAMSEQQKDFLNTITTYNIEARHPETKEDLARKLDKDTCRYIIDGTKTLQTWIKQQL